ncbi:uncharacterized protein LOC100678701 isoform X1 [Nasonia vitripennis]|uniref:Uncharacterized protein n=1 Tax=Nasonia vitripennis TaxID=7425 RepID=A0A7M7QK35_NASVI|nr:uncharacterized protein LOC100678701 isoform X1 [Nasonia vitripennis]XP_031786837.1 uncharacterized protein LOC100678701 isoform X1 [Nasonia vitripennis]XP_031786838.1 uncharacterized protein LOC100678701 isoform X1 [Nasonia vitripennis]XP_031786839.1 uncharacterized protein LOC100678701 isoform X1 [Nasonia vitripennis]
MIRWLMVGLLLFTESACESGRNALPGKNGKNEKESAATRATATTAEENIYRLTCYTCVNVSDNKMCNEWAIDTPCPAGGRDFCRSLHILDSRGQSVLASIPASITIYYSREQELRQQNRMQSGVRRLRAHRHAKDMHKLLRHELLQHRVADERDERDVLAQAAQTKEPQEEEEEEEEEQRPRCGPGRGRGGGRGRGRGGGRGRGLNRVPVDTLPETGQPRLRHRLLLCN